MRELLLAHPNVLLVLQILVVGSGAILLSLTFFVVPFRVNQRLDPILGPQKKGDRWEVGKSPAFYGYFYHRATDYAQAVLSERYCRKKFGISRATIRSHLGRVGVFICFVFKICEYTFFSLVTGLTIGILAIQLMKG
jgi:hypothetical protein